MSRKSRSLRVVRVQYSPPVCEDHSVRCSINSAVCVCAVAHPCCFQAALKRYIRPIQVLTRCEWTKLVADCLCGRTIVSTVLCSYLEMYSLNNWRPSAIAEKWDASEAPELLGIKCSFVLSFHSTPPTHRGLCLFREQLPEAVGPTSKL